MNRLLMAIPLVVSALMAGCVTNPSVSVQSEPGVNIASYDSFGFISPLGTDRNGYSSFLSSHLKQATRTALEAKGYVYKETHPAMLVNFNTSVQQKTDVDDMGPGVMAPGPLLGFRAGMYGAWPGYGDVVVDQYQEGKLVIDLVDPAKKQMIWEGIGTQIVGEDWRDHPEKLENAVNHVLESVPSSK